MGGVGSGRWKQRGSKGLVEAHACLSIRALPGTVLRRVGTTIQCRLHRAAAGGGHGPSVVTVTVRRGAVALAYRLPGEPPTRSYQAVIALDATPCPYGGHRFWFRCPGSGGPARCGRRVAQLFYTARLQGFACRQCLQLVYASQRRAPLDQAIHDAHAIMRRLGATPTGLPTVLPPRPTGMHQQTYRRMAQAYRHAVVLLELAFVLDWARQPPPQAMRSLPTACVPEPPLLLAADGQPLRGAAYLRQVRRDLRASRQRTWAPGEAEA